MREIKFRAKDKNGNWAYGELLRSEHDFVKGYDIITPEWEQVKTVNENGDETTLTQAVNPYGTGIQKDDDGNDIDGSDFYYISEDELSNGDVLVSSSGSDTYTVGDTASLQGVYNINEGYADFTEVTVIKQNDEYAIVQPNDTYGLREYDYIVLDATTMTPGEFVVTY